MNAVCCGVQQIDLVIFLTLSPVLYVVNGISCFTFTWELTLRAISADKMIFMHNPIFLFCEKMTNPS